MCMYRVSPEFGSDQSLLAQYFSRPQIQLSVLVNLGKSF